jgi:dTDP-4-amino-4,6-dideoxygalactose transaminase
LVIDDAAQSFGGSIGGKLIGTFGEVGILSFGLGKILAATGGGLAITDSDKIAEKLKKLDCGKALKREKIKRIAYWLFLRRWRKYFLVIGPWILRLLAPTTLGTNKKPIELCNVDAAIALRQLNRLGKILEIRKNRKKRLDDLFNRFEPSVCGVFINKSERELVSVATKYVRLFNFAGHGNDIQEKYGTYLGLKGIEIQPLYTPMHHNPIYCQDQINLPKTEKCYKSLCQVPIEPSISDDEFDRVVEAVTEFLDQIRIADPDSVLV